MSQAVELTKLQNFILRVLAARDDGFCSDEEMERLGEWYENIIMGNAFLENIESGLMGITIPEHGEAEFWLTPLGKETAEKQTEAQ